MSAVDVIKGTCPQCSGPVELDVTGASEWLLTIAQAAANSPCPACAEAIEKAEEQAEADALAGRVAVEHQDRLRLARVPEVSRRFDRSTVPATVAEAAEAWANREILTLTLTGPVGTGKTQVAVDAFRRRLTPFVKGGRIISRRGAWRRMGAHMANVGADFGSPAKDDVIELAQGGVVLGLDDIDKVQGTEYAGLQVLNLVEGAYGTGAPMIVTTNLSLSQIKAKWGGDGAAGDGIASRLAEGVVVRYDGPDRRLRRA